MNPQERKHLGPLRLIIIYGFGASGLANVIVSRVLQPRLRLDWGWEAFLVAAIGGGLAVIVHGLLKRLGYL